MLLAGISTQAASVGAPAKSVSGRRYPRPAAVVAPDVAYAHDAFLCFPPHPNMVEELGRK